MGVRLSVLKVRRLISHHWGLVDAIPFLRTDYILSKPVLRYINLRTLLNGRAAKGAVNSFTIKSVLVVTPICRQAYFKFIVILVQFNSHWQPVCSVNLFSTHFSSFLCHDLSVYCLGDLVAGTFLVPLRVWLALAFLRMWSQNICLLKLVYLSSRQYKGYRRHCLLLTRTCTIEHVPGAVSFVVVYDEFCHQIRKYLFCSFWIWMQCSVLVICRLRPEARPAGLVTFGPAQKIKKPKPLLVSKTKNFTRCVIGRCKGLV